MIELEKVVFGYPNSGYSTGEVTVTLTSKDILAVSGENGSGKTTLLRLFSGILKAQSGERKITDGCRVSLVPAELQHYLLPWYSVAKNFSFFHSGGASTSSKDIESIRTYLSEHFDSLPFSIEELENRKIWELSTGQLGIVGLACAMLTRPSVLLLDETFSNMSYNIVQRICKGLKQLASDGVCIVFTSHNPQIINLLASHVYDIATYTKRTVPEHEEIV